MRRGARLCDGCLEFSDDGVLRRIGTKARGDGGQNGECKGAGLCAPARFEAGVDVGARAQDGTGVLFKLHALSGCQRVPFVVEPGVRAGGVVGQSARVSLCYRCWGGDFGIDACQKSIVICAAVDGDAVDIKRGRTGDVGSLGIFHIFDDGDGILLSFDGVEDIVKGRAEGFQNVF